MKIKEFMRLFVCLLLCNWWFLVNNVTAAVRLLTLFSDNMVIQNGMKIPVWGWAEPGEKVLVTLGNSKTSTIADVNGKWQVRLEPVQPGTTLEMDIHGKNTVRIKNILVGEVWLASGQSNMNWPVWLSKNAEQEIASANYPAIRIFTIPPDVVADQPQEDCKGSWSVCGPETVRDFSAVGYFFARYLHQQLQVPVGIIHASWGGTDIEAWMRRDILVNDVDFEPILTRWDAIVARYPEMMKEYLPRREQWNLKAEEARIHGDGLPPDFPRPQGPGHRNTPSGLYNSMIAPIIPYAIRGVVWYQGENNVVRAYQYRKLFPALIKSWRDDWGQGDFPFYYVQIAPISLTRMEPFTWAELREAQMMALTLTNTGMVVTTDLVDSTIDFGEGQIHPKNKQDVGKRLALWALAKTYGHDVVCSGPLYKSMSIEGNAIRLRFDYVGSGLVAKDGPLTEFTIAGEDMNFVEAHAVIEGDTIVVSSEKVEKPVAVRFGWKNCPLPNLFNREGLPASPFRTDNWPGVTDKRK